MEKISKRSDRSPEKGKEEYGNTKFADPVNKAYPLDTPKHIRAAAAYWGREGNREEYSEGRKLIGNRIQEAMDKLQEEEMSKKGYVKGSRSGMMIKKPE